MKWPNTQAQIPKTQIIKTYSRGYGIYEWTYNKENELVIKNLPTKRAQAQWLHYKFCQTFKEAII